MSLFLQQTRQWLEYCGLPIAFRKCKVDIKGLPKAEQLWFPEIYLPISSDVRALYKVTQKIRTRLHRESNTEPLELLVRCYTTRPKRHSTVSSFIISILRPLFHVKHRFDGSWISALFLAWPWFEICMTLNIPRYRMPFLAHRCLPVRSSIGNCIKEMPYT